MRVIDILWFAMLQTFVMIGMDELHTEPAERATTREDDQLQWMGGHGNHCCHQRKLDHVQGM